MNTKNKGSIKKRLLLSLILFFVIVLALVWISEVFLFKKAYENYQVKTLDLISTKLKNTNYDDLSLSMESLAYQNQVCIIKTSSTNVEEEYNTKMNNCVLNYMSADVKNIIRKFINSNEESNTFRISLQNKKIVGYLYGLKIGDKYIFIYSNSEDTSNVTTILTNQMIYITLFASIAAVIISYFLSNKVTQPIIEITNKAKYLGTGKDIKFERHGILELDELTDALNLAQSEIGKTENLQRDLLANVSHDLKTPLTMIKAYAEMIKDISYKDKDKMNEHLNIIIDETDRLTILVNDILNLSKLQANAEQLTLEKYDIVQEIKTIIKRYDIIKETENYDFVLDLPDKLLVTADKNKINQVIYNLINNAINFTGEDKKVIIKVTKEKKIEITDTGKGIKKEEIDTIWNRYYKTNKKHKRNVISTGLGLSIVKEILLKHNFKYGVESSNHGTTFYFFIK